MGGFGVFLVGIWFCLFVSVFVVVVGVLFVNLYFKTATIYCGV